MAVVRELKDKHVYLNSVENSQSSRSPRLVAVLMWNSPRKLGISKYVFAITTTSAHFAFRALVFQKVLRQLALDQLNQRVSSYANIPPQLHIASSIHPVLEVLCSRRVEVSVRSHRILQSGWVLKYLFNYFNISVSITISNGTRLCPKRSYGRL